MKNGLKTGVVLVVTLAATAACTRRVQVESEPNRPEYRIEQTSAVDAEAVTSSAPARR